MLAIDTTGAINWVCRVVLTYMRGCLRFGNTGYLSPIWDADCTLTILELTGQHAVQSGKMTKDLAICFHGTNKVTPDQYLNTIPFMDAVEDTLKSKLAHSRL